MGDLETLSCDVVVVGLGPAGATAAARLSAAGLSVIGLEKARHPRDKPCGGGLSARIEKLLDPGFKAIVEGTIHGVTFTYDGEGTFHLDCPTPVAYMVMRRRFDQLLARQAQERGACLYEGEAVQRCRMTQDAVEVDTAGRRYRARVLIGADGANSVVARELLAPHRPACMPALEAEWPSVHDEYLGHARIHIDVGVNPNGYAWIFPKQEGVSVGVAQFRGRARTPRGALRRFGQVTGLGDGVVAAAVGHPLPLHDGSRSLPLVMGNALLVGDAAHLVDPLLGEGIYYAVRSGQLAADSVLDLFEDARKGLRGYEEAVRREIYPEFEVAAKMARVIYSFPRLCYRLMDRSEAVIRLYCDMLGGRESYHSFIVKTKGIIRDSLNWRDLWERLSRRDERDGA